MTALTQDRNTPQLHGKDFGFPLGAAKTIFAGSIVMITHAGYAEAATTATDKICVGVSPRFVDNSAGAAGAESVAPMRGIFRMASAGDITWQHVNQPAYAVDDQTVSASSAGSTRSQAGIIRSLDTLGVWVEF